MFCGIFLYGNRRSHHKYLHVLEMSFIVLASARLETSDAPVGTSLHRNHYPLIRGVSLHHARQPFVAPYPSFPLTVRSRFPRCWM